MYMILKARSDWGGLFHVGTKGFLLGIPWGGGGGVACWQPTKRKATTQKQRNLDRIETGGTAAGVKSLIAECSSFLECDSD